MPPNILVVESDFDLADVIRSVLVADAYSSLTIPHGFLATLSFEPQSIDLVLCEIDALAARGSFRLTLDAFISMHSATLIYITGSELRPKVLPRYILQKPFSVDALIETVSNAFYERAAREVL